MLRLRPLAAAIACLASALAAADPVVFPGLPPVPNPFGFDDRLALRTHLEETYGRRDVVGKELDQLVEIYRGLVAPKPAAAPEPPARDPAQDLAAAERVRRENILLQLRLQFGVTPDAAAATDEIERLLAERIAGERSSGATAGTPAADAGAATAAREAAPAEPALDETPREIPRDIVRAKVSPFDTSVLRKPLGVRMGLRVETGRELVVGVCFSEDLEKMLRPILGVATNAMVSTRAAKTCLVLLGHGDGTSIGVGGDDPVDLTRHLQANRAAYHQVLGVERIDCVAILSCARQSDRQFKAFRDGLGYYPERRVSAWEHTYQNAYSGLAALHLALMQPANSQLRTAVFIDAKREVGSLAEVGSRTGTTYVRAVISDDSLKFVPERR